MKKVKVYGAGSIGNHLSHAARSLGWAVDICDVSCAALQRTREEIYPSRYGQWDTEIGLYHSDNAPRGGYDYIFVGTPPDIHVALARDAIDEGVGAILIEKPLATPDLDGLQQLREAAKAAGTPIFVGYDHVVGQATRELATLVATGKDIRPLTIDVEFREHWGGIFNAHPWLAGPQDTYLGFSSRGGGASGEHSHAINLWQHFAHLCGAGRVAEVSATIDFGPNGDLDYDQICALNLITETGLTGRVIQDVVTRPPRKWARIQGDAGHIEWHCGYKQGSDAVVSAVDGQKDKLLEIEKTRPDDFIAELTHLEDSLASDPASSPIALDRGLDTMLVIAAAHLSAREKATIRINYAAGYVPEALTRA